MNDGAALGLVLDQVSKDKNIDRAVLVETLEQAILTAAKRAFGMNREMEAKFSSLLTVFRRQVTASDASLSQAGFDTIIPQYPLPDDEVEALTLRPDPERR